MTRGSTNIPRRRPVVGSLALMSAIVIIAATLAACDSAEELVTGQLIIRDPTVGTGVAVEATDSIRVYYVLTRTDDGDICDLWTRSSPFNASGDNEPRGFSLGETDPSRKLIDGFEQGMLGAREGGRRVITIPPNLGYGLDPPRQQNCIRSNEFLEFTVDLIEVVKR